MGCTCISYHNFLPVFLRGRSRRYPAKSIALGDCNVGIDNTVFDRFSVGASSYYASTRALP